MLVKYPHDTWHTAATKAPIHLKGYEALAPAWPDGEHCRRPRSAAASSTPRPAPMTTIPACKVVQYVSRTVYGLPARRLGPEPRLRKCEHFVKAAKIEVVLLAAFLWLNRLDLFFVPDIRKRKYCTRSCHHSQPQSRTEMPLNTLFWIPRLSLTNPPSDF
jgi:hypothetical protein